MSWKVLLENGRFGGNTLVYSGFCAALPMGRVCVYMGNVKNKPCLLCNQGFSEARTKFLLRVQTSLPCGARSCFFAEKGVWDGAKPGFRRFLSLFCEFALSNILPLRRRVCPIFAGVPDASFSDVCSSTEKTRMSIFFSLSLRLPLKYL